MLKKHGFILSHNVELSRKMLQKDELCVNFYSLHKSFALYSVHFTIKVCIYLQKNDEIILNITDMTSDGSGIGKYDGMAIFVPLTAIGDTARVKILKVKISN